MFEIFNGVYIIAGASVGLIVLACAVVWLRRRPKSDPYDLRRLNDLHLSGEAFDDMVTDESGPYCVRCDNPNPEGTYYCRSCGQKIA